MKVFLALAFLAALSLAAGVDLKNLKPLDIVMPVNPSYTWKEWQEIFAAQVPNPENKPTLRFFGEPQPEFSGKVHVPLKEEANRITGGSTASRGQFPWEAAIIINGATFCVGSLISTQWVLTVAHCAGSSYQVTLGANRIDTTESGSLTVTSSSSIVHSGYDSSTLNNNIAVIRLPFAITLTTYINSIRLRSISGDLAGASVRVSGWGRTSNCSSSVIPTLNYVDLKVITNTVCSQTYGSIISSNKLCAVTSGGQCICNDDRGSPAVYLESDGIYTLVGIVSFVSSAGCERGYPVIFTRITSYLSWITSNTGVRFE